VRTALEDSAMGRGEQVVEASRGEVVVEVLHEIVGLFHLNELLTCPPPQGSHGANRHYVA